MAQKAESGGMLGFFPPFGYRIKDKDLVVVEDEAEVVRELFRRYCEGESMAALAESLNERGLPTRRGQRWTLYSVRHILQPVCRLPRWMEYSSRAASAIIDVGLFNAAQVIAADRTGTSRFRSEHAPV